MALSNRERSQRHRAHKRGDHRFCRDPERCERDATPVVPAESAVEGVQALLAVVTFDADDPRATLSVIALRLAQAFDESPNASLARELRGVLGDIADHPTEPAGMLVELRAKRMARRVEALLRPPPVIGERGW